MGLTINANGFATAAQRAEQEAGKHGKQIGKNFFGGNLKLAEDPLEKRRQEAKQQAWKVVSDAWASDNAVDRQMDDRRAHYAEMQALKDEADKQVDELNGRKEALKELYQVTDDSEEQEELKLLEKAQDFKNGVSHEKPTQEEQKRIDEIEARGLTEYQSRALQLNDQAAKFKLEIEEADQAMLDDISDVNAIKQERLKTHPMIDAQKAAEAIMDAANKEIVGMTVQEGMDHLDEKMEEAEEKAEENMEKKEEKEELLEEQKEMRVLQEAFIEGTREAIERAEAEHRQNEAPDIEITDMVDMIKHRGDSANQVQSDLKDIQNSMKVLEADLKGIKVDEEV